MKDTLHWHGVDMATYGVCGMLIASDPTHDRRQSVLHHLAVFRFNAGTTTDQIDAISDGLATLPSQIDALRAYRFGPDVGIIEGSWDYGVAADFDDETSYAVYADHPAHVAVITEKIKPFVDEIARVQFLA
jgi:hypothetical protein